MVVLLAGLCYNSIKQSLMHWKNACRRETPPVAGRQRHFSRFARKVESAEHNGKIFRLKTWKHRKACMLWPYHIKG